MIHSLSAPRSHQPLSDHLEGSAVALGDTLLTNINLAAPALSREASPKMGSPRLGRALAKGKISPSSHSWTPPVSWWQTALRGLLCRQEREGFLGGAFVGIGSL